MTDAELPVSPTGATYVEPSADEILKPGHKIGNLLRRNMTQPYVLQRLTQRAWWVQSFNYGTVFLEIIATRQSMELANSSLPRPTTVLNPDLINPDQPPFWRFAGNERFRFHEDNLKQIYGLEWDYLSGSHGNIGWRADIDFEFAFSRKPLRPTRKWWRGRCSNIDDTTVCPETTCD